MIRDLLVHVDASKAGAWRLDYVVALARLTGARVTGLHVTPPAEVAPVYKPSQVEHVRELIEEGAELDAHEAEKLFLGKVAGGDVRSEWRQLAGNMVETISREAQTSDIVILGQYEWEGPTVQHPLSLAEALVERCGCPLLVVPGENKFELPRRALVAWDGSREAVRAVHDAIPLIQAGSIELEIAWFKEHHEAEDLEKLQRHLVRHDVVVADLLALEAGGSASARLLERLRKGHFDLLVMGAFGHPAWFEFLFGGTTAAALLKASVPVFVSH